MPDVPAVLVDDVTKSFKIPRQHVSTLKERIIHPLKRTDYDVIRALRGVTFEIPKGDFFGVVGRNGSGKSTLLKCLAGIYGVDSGAMFIDGRLSSFIELGVGFNPDLPARDNVLLNATMLGLSPREARNRFDAVIDFAELQDFTDLKLKNYSSGMMVRLAFSVMIQVDADVLLIDEVLAVGDAAFQQKCYDEFARIKRSGSTVILVSHDMGAVQRFCDRALLVEAGRVVSIGAPDAIANRYLELNFSPEAREAERARVDSGRPQKLVAAAAGEAADEDEVEEARHGTGEAKVCEAWFEHDGERVTTLNSGEVYSLCARVRFEQDVEDPLFSFALQNPEGLSILAASTAWTEPWPGTFHAGEEVEFRVRFPAMLGADRYHLTLSVERHGGSWLDHRWRMASIVVTNARQNGTLLDVPMDVDLVRTGAVQ